MIARTMPVAEYRREVARRMSERELQNHIVDAAHKRGWLVMHVRPAQKRDGQYVTPIQGDAGFPDLVLARNGRRIFAELKREGKDPEPAQELWLAALGDAHVWRPSDWLRGDIVEALA